MIRGERGATALTVAMVMVLLMGVAAVVLDGGRGFNERRQAQSGVDFASLAALVAATGANPSDAGRIEAQAVVAANLPGRVLDWTSPACTDTNRPPEYTNLSSSPCVSFTENYGQARVILPTDALDTTFGNLLGFNSIDVRTEAEAIQTIKSSANILPLTAAAGTSVCLFSNQAPQTVPPCNGPNSGFFGYLDVALHGSSPSELDNPSTCEQGTANVRTAINVAKGADHIMVEWNPGDPVVHDWAVCPNLSEDINQLQVQTGSPVIALTNGLINGVSGSINGQSFGSAPGRIVYDAAWSTASASVRGFTLDNTPLWTYLDDPACSWATGITGNVDNYTEMQNCLDQWTSGSIFSESLEDNKRFAAVPVFTTFPTGPGAYLIDFFSPVYIETTYHNCNANRCHTIFSPGEAGGSSVCPPNLAAAPTVNCGHSHTSGPDSVEGLTAFQLRVGMLHPNTQEFFPATNNVREIFLLK